MQNMNHVLKNLFSDTINKVRPTEPESKCIGTNIEGNEEKVVPNSSPLWQRSTKQYIVIGAVILALICIFFLRNMLAPLSISMLLSYIMRPAACFLRDNLKISWKASVAILYIFLILMLIGMLVGGGVAFYNQAKNLVDFISTTLNDLPERINDLLSESDPNNLLLSLFQQYFATESNEDITSKITSLFNSSGNVLGSFAQGVTSRIAWIFFVIGFSFFVVWETDNRKEQPVFIIKGYEYDIRMADYHLKRIWNGFLRGQLCLFGIAVIVYLFLFLILGVNYAFVLSIVVGVTRLIPYIGSFFAWVGVGLVTLFQGTSLFGMNSIVYAILVVGISFLIDKFMDGFIQPKFLAETLKIHPAMVLVFTFVLSRIMGVIGIFFAAPVVATLKLLLNYVIRKLQDKDPWEGIETVNPGISLEETFRLWKQNIEKHWTIIKRKAESIIKRVRQKKENKNGI